MTLPELSAFMKKQELELQLRTEKEREEGECWRADAAGNTLGALWVSPAFLIIWLRTKPR